MRLVTAMKRLLILGLCLALSIFAIARAMKPSRTLAVVAKGAESTPTEQKAETKPLPDDSNNALAQGEEQEGAADEHTGDEVTSDDGDAIADASDNQGADGADVSDADASDDDDATDDDSGDDDDGGDDNGNGGGV